MSFDGGLAVLGKTVVLRIDNVTVQYRFFNITIRQKML